MKKSALGFVSFLLVLVAWLGFAIIWVVSHYKLITYGNKGLGGALYEMLSGTLIMLVPAVLIVSIIAFFQDKFAIKSYSFLALLLILGTLVYAFIPR